MLTYHTLALEGMTVLSSRWLISTAAAVVRVVSFRKEITIIFVLISRGETI